jgi:hypothetical protein
MHLIGWAAYLVVESPEFASVSHIHRRFTNQAIDIDTLSRCVFAHGKASKRRCSTPTASFDNSDREQTHNGLSLNIIRIEATSVAQLGVAALDKGLAIAGTPRKCPWGTP